MADDLAAKLGDTQHTKCDGSNFAGRRGAVPYGYETIFIQTHHPYELHSWYLYIKNKCDSVGDGALDVPIS